MFRRLCLRVAPIALAASLAAPRVGFAQPTTEVSPAAKAHVKKAAVHYKAEEYELAAAEFKEAYAVDPTPDILFNWAQAVRRSGDCRKARALYDQYLDTNPDAENARMARANKLDCVDRPEESPSEVDEKKPAYKDWLGGTLLGVGIAAAIGGGVLLAVGKRQVEQDSRKRSLEDQYQSDIDAGRSKYTAGAVVLGIGGALIVGGVIRYSVLAARNKKKANDRSTRVVPGPGFGLALQGRF